MKNVKMTVWGAEFDHVPYGFIAPMAAELVLRELERRGHIQYDEDDHLRYTSDDWKTLVFIVRVSDRFMAVTTVERTANGLHGEVNIFNVDALPNPEETGMRLQTTLPIQTSFVIPYGFSWNAEALFLSSDGPYTSICEDHTERLTRDLILATKAGKVFC